MAPRGRRPLPTNVLEMRGSWRAKTRVEEPRPTAEIPPTPRELDKGGKRIWRALSKELAAVGLVTRLDAHALTRYIQLSQHWHTLHQFIVQHGECYDVIKYHEIKAHYDDDGHLVHASREPYVARTEIRAETRLWLALSDRLARLESAFGMSPQARAAIGLALAAAREVEAEVPVNPKRFLNLG